MTQHPNRKILEEKPTDFSAVFRAAPGLYLLLLPDAPKYSIITANEAYAKATLTRSEDLAGRGIFDAFPDNPDDSKADGVANLRASLDHVVKHLQAHEMALQKYDVLRPENMGGGYEEKYWLPLNTPVFNKNGEIEYIIHRVEDVTARVRAERERDRYLNVAADMLAVGGFDGYLKHCNEAWGKNLGWSAEEMTSKPWIDFVHPDDIAKTIEAGNALVEGRKLGEFENRYICKDGSYRWLSWNSVAYSDEQLIYGAATDITDKIKAETERERFFHVAADLLVVASFDGNFQYVNPAWEKHFGWTVEEMRAQPWLWFVHHDDYDMTVEVGNALIAGQQDIKCENRYRCKDGSYRWLSWNTKPFVKERLIYCAAIDITERKKAEEALFEKDNRLRVALQAGRMGTWELDVARSHLTASETCNTNYGLRPDEELTYQRLYSLVHDDDREYWTAKVTEAIKAASDFEMEYRTRWENGTVHWIYVRGSCTKIVDGKAAMLSGVSVNITERKLLESTLKEAQQFSQSIIDSSPDCIKVLDLEGNLLSMNEEGCRQMEVDDFSVCVNQPWVSFWGETERDNARRCLNEANAGKTAHFEGFCATMKGTPKWWEVIVTPILGKEGKPERLLSVSRDITARRKLLELAEKSQEAAESANLAKSEFLANMSHEIRTPMNAVIGLSNILARSEGLSTKQKEYVRTLQLSADSLLGLINDLLDISKIEARSIELEHIPFNMTQLLSEVASMMSLRAKEKGLEFTTNAELTKDHMLVGDPTRIRQIALNLCSNAIKFTNKGSVHISLTTEPSDMDGVENIILAVSDTGIGIPLDKQATIFHKFIQADSSINRQYGGTGLGLAITKTLTEIMDGTIELHSVSGQGTTFTVKLPLMVGDNKQSDRPQQKLREEKTISPEHRILLVEDYAANVLVAGSYLESFGYHYDVANNGHEAVEKAKTGNYLAILMDVQMPGINGFEATKLIRSYEKKEGKPRTPIIGITAHALMGDNERCISADMDDYLSKPYNPDILEKLLGKYADEIVS